MKINVTVDIDWIEEDGSIDEEVKHELIHGIKRAISTKCLANMENEAKEAISLAVSNAGTLIEKKALEFVEDWLESKVKISDKWGDTAEEGTIHDLIKARFDDLLNQRVNDKGEFTNGYGANGTLIEYLTGKKVRESVNERMKDFGRDIDKQIKDNIEKSIKSNVSDKFAQMVIGVAKQEYAETQALISRKD